MNTATSPTLPPAFTGCAYTFDGDPAPMCAGNLYVSVGAHGPRSPRTNRTVGHTFLVAGETFGGRPGSSWAVYVAINPADQFDFHALVVDEGGWDVAIRWASTELLDTVQREVVARLEALDAADPSGAHYAMGTPVTPLQLSQRRV